MSCLHCDSYTSTDQKFCCLGCKTAYSIIHSLNLNQYYDFCKKVYDTVPSKIEKVHNAIDYIQFVKTKQNMAQSIDLFVEGVKCGSCVWLIESSLRKQENVLKAFFNMTTKTLSITWIGPKERINEFINLIESIGYKVIPFIEAEIIKKQRQAEKSLLKNIALSGAIWIQNMMISMGMWAGNISGEIGIYSRIFMNISAFILTIPIILYTSKTFFKSAWYAIKLRQSHMDIPISIAILITLIISVYGTFIGSEFVFYEAVSSLVFALLVGKYFETKVRNKASEYARNLILQKSLFATVLRNNALEMVSISSIKIGEILYIASGETIPLDGEIISGESEIDNSIITGESKPKVVKINDRVFAGAINLKNPIQISVQSDDEHTVLSEIKRLIASAEHQKSKYQNFASKVAKIYTPVVLCLFLITTFIWTFYDTFQTAILYGISVLVITCPCAMGIAIPIVHTLAVSNLIKQGIFVKTHDALERLSSVESLALDKTGVLTYGKPVLLNVHDIPQEYRCILKSLSMQSKHHLCIAIMHALKNEESVEIHSLYEEKGYGISGQYKENYVFLGRAEWCGVTHDLKSENDLYTYFVLRNENKNIIISLQLRLSDRIREESFDFVKNIKQFMKSIFIISGDYKENVKEIAKYLDIKEFYAELTPQDKFNIIKKQKTKVLMIGDGLNDAAAMTIAHCSASPANIIELSQNQSDIVFQNNLNNILKAIQMSKKFVLVCKQNIAISVIYNIISIPFAMLGYASPLVAAIFMSLSSIFVIVNTLLQMKEKSLE